MNVGVSLSSLLPWFHLGRTSLRSCPKLLSSESPALLPGSPVVGSMMWIKVTFHSSWEPGNGVAFWGPDDPGCPSQECRRWHCPAASLFEIGAVGCIWKSEDWFVCQDHSIVSWTLSTWRAMSNQLTALLPLLRPAFTLLLFLCFMALARPPGICRSL